MTDKHVDGTSDERVVNNTMRHQYRVLTDAEKALVNEVKTKGDEFLGILHKIGKTGPFTEPQSDGVVVADPERFGSANLTLSFRHIEDAVYRAVKHITK